jgi:hypothetical protein
MKLPIFKIFKYSRRASIIATVGGLIVIFGGTSAYAAHSNALPGSTLYPLKQLWEQGQLLLSFSPTSKAQAQIDIAHDRIKAAQAVVSQTPAATNGSNAIPALQHAQEQLNKALSNADKITDPTQRQEIKKSISDAATEAEAELEQENESASDSDKQDIQHTSEEIKKVKDQASSND